MNTTNTQDPIRAALDSTGCERLRDFFNVGSVQRAAVESFVAALQAAQPRVVDPETSRAIDEAAKAGRFVFEPGWNAQPQCDAREAAEAWRKTPCDDGWHAQSLAYKLEAAFQAGAAWQAASTQPRVWTPEEIEAANKRAAEYTDWYLSGGKIASTQASEPSAAQLLDAIRRAGFTAVRNTHGVHLMKLGEATAYAAPAQASEPSAAPARAVEPLTPREIELIDGMIEVQLHHAAQCDGIGNRKMADKQKGWDMERVELLQKLRTHGIGIPATTPTQDAQGGEA